MTIGPKITRNLGIRLLIRMPIHIYRLGWTVFMRLLTLSRKLRFLWKAISILLEEMTMELVKTEKTHLREKCSL